jgi:hypothetical protein
VLIGLIGQEVTPIAMSAVKVKPVSTDDLDSWERKIEQGVVNDPSIPETDRLAIVRARKGQGLFEERVGKQRIEGEKLAGIYEAWRAVADVSFEDKGQRTFWLEPFRSGMHEPISGKSC